MKPNLISVRGASYAKLAALDKLPLTHDWEGEAERPSSGAPESGSDAGADAEGSQVQCVVRPG
jgi:hypothetical protein